MASSAIVRGTGADRSAGGALGGLRNHFTAAVVSARAADVVGQLELAAIRALDQIDLRQAVMRATHVALRSRYLFPRYCHQSRPRLGAAALTAPSFSCSNSAADGPSDGSSWPKVILGPSSAGTRV